MSTAQYFIAKVTQLDQYVVLQGSTVVSGPYQTAKEAIAARDALVKAGPVAAGDIPSGRETLEP